MSDVLRILFLEDVPRDADLVIRELRRSGHPCEARLVWTRAGMLRELEAFAPHAILSDYAMPQFTGMEALEIRNERAPDLPFILVTASINEQTAVECIKRGADDYVLKQHLAGLPHAIETALEKKRLECLEREAQEQLRLTAQHWRRTFDAINDALAVLDADRKVVHANRALSDLLGKPREQVVGRDCCRLLHGLDAPPPACPAVRASRSGKRETWQADIGGRWFELIADPIFDDTGRLSGMVHVFSDITESRDSREALQKSESFLNTLLETIPIPVFYKDREGRYLGFNKAFESFWGTPRERLLGKTVEEVGPPEFTQEYLAKDLELLEGGGEQQYESKLKAAHGELRDVVLNKAVFRDSQGVVSGLIGTVVDITDRKKAEEALAASERRYRALFEGASEGILVADAKGRTFLYANSAVCRLLGYPKDELLQLGIKDIHPKERLPKVLATFDAQARGEMTLAPDTLCLRKDGTVIRVEVNTAPVEMDGRPCVVGFFTDITGRMRLEGEKEALEAQLRQAQKLEAVARLAGGVAHDFNNMLSVIIGYAEMAMYEAASEDPVQRHLREILSAGMRSRDIARQLLAFARREVIQPKVLDLNTAVSSMFKMLRRLLGENIDLVWAPAGEVWRVMMDPSQMDQIIANLCVSASDAIGDVGRVAIETRNFIVDEVYCAMRAGATPGEYVMLAISDDGCGMDRETLERIFEPFFTTKGSGKGTGLGLSTVYGIVQQNGGFINVSSEPGKGTTFRIYLPRHADPASEGHEGVSQPIPCGHGETVLVVEDEEPILRLTRDLLVGLGYRPLTAATPSGALKLAEQHRGEIALLITDVVMPKMNGRDLAERLQSLYPGMKRLFMSGYAADAVTHRGVLQGGLPFVQKPFSKMDLAVKVREALENGPSK